MEGKITSVTILCTGTILFRARASGSDYKVSVQSISQPTIKDASNTYFTLTSGTITPTPKPIANEQIKVGIYKDGVWYLDYNTNGIMDTSTVKAYNFGAPGFIPVLGKWG